MTDTVTPTQADREAAEALAKFLAITPTEGNMNGIVQVLTRRGAQARLEGARMMQHAAALVCGSLAETTYDDSDGFEAATGCESAIRRLDPAEVVKG